MFPIQGLKIADATSLVSLEGLDPNTVSMGFNKHSEINTGPLPEWDKGHSGTCRAYSSDFIRRFATEKE